MRVFVAQILIGVHNKSLKSNTRVREAVQPAAGDFFLLPVLRLKGHPVLTNPQTASQLLSLLLSVPLHPATSLSVSTSLVLGLKLGATTTWLFLSSSPGWP